MSGLGSINFNYGNQYNYLPSNNNTFTRPEPTNYEPQNPEKTILAAGMLQAFAIFLQKASQWCGNKLMCGKEFTTEANVKKTAENMVRKNNLNVTVDFIDGNNIRNYPPSLHRELIPVAKGENAFYTDQLKLAVAPKNKPSLILHELGHAINAHKGKFLRFLQKSRGYVSAVPTALLLLNGLFRRDDNKPNFVEKNAGIIGFAAFLPTIAEEGLASIRGVKAARNTLGKSVNLSPLKRNYFFAWLTYVIAGIGLGVAAKQSMLENKR